MMNKTDQEGIVSRMMRLYGCTKDAELADRMGVVKSTVSRYRNGQIKLSLAAVLKAAQETGCTADWLLTGKPSVPAPVLSIQTAASPEIFHQDFAADSYLTVRLLRDEIAAGMPSEIRDNDIDGYCLIYADKAWMPGNPENYTCCRVRGDSMYPILADGDIVAIDHSLKDPKALHKKNGRVPICRRRGCKMAFLYQKRNRSGNSRKQEQYGSHNLPCGRGNRNRHHRQSGVVVGQKVGPA